jgi:preprotein translocase subunit SecA
MTLPVISKVYETQGDQFKNIEIPITDGKKALPLVVNMEEALSKEGRNIRLELEKASTLAMIDQHWKEHLREMDDLRQSVQNAVYEQKDPLLIYKFESFKLFEQMIDRVNREIVQFLFRAGLPNQQSEQVQATQEAKKVDTLANVTATRRDVTQNPSENKNLNTNTQETSEVKKEPVKVEKTPGRNDKVEVRDLKTGATQVVKYKAAEFKVQQGDWEILQVLD